MYAFLLRLFSNESHILNFIIIFDNKYCIEFIIFFTQIYLNSIINKSFYEKLYDRCIHEIKAIDNNDSNEPIFGQNLLNAITVCLLKLRNGFKNDGFAQKKVIHEIDCRENDKNIINHNSFN